MIQIFRVLIPSWRFFNDAIEAPVLQYRVFQENQDATSTYSNEWTNCLPPTGKRSWYQFYINPIELKYFASHAILEHFVEREDCRDTSILLIRNLVNQLHQDRDGMIGDCLQFKIIYSHLHLDGPAYTSETFSCKDPNS